MELKFKNKYQLGLDGMIADASQLGGVPDFILLEANEAFNLLIEASNLKEKYIKILTVKKDNVDITMSLWNISRTETEELVQKWYKREYLVSYNNIELRIMKQEKSAPPPPPPPLGRIVYESYGKHCDKCDSSLKRKWLFWTEDGCIQPECDNYYQNHPKG